MCPTTLNVDETLFALQFATRARNISLGPARKNVGAKNLLEEGKDLRAKLREAGRKKVLRKFPRFSDRKPYEYFSLKGIGYQTLHDLRVRTVRTLPAFTLAALVDTPRFLWIPIFWTLRVKDRISIFETLP